MINHKGDLGEGDQMRNTEWSKQRSGGEGWGEKTAGEGVPNALACFAAAIVTGEATAGRVACAVVPEKAFVSANGWMWQSSAGICGVVFPQRPAGLQQPARELWNMKY